MNPIGMISCPIKPACSDKVIFSALPHSLLGAQMKEAAG